MSIDVSVQLYFPIAMAAQALAATRKALRKRKFVLGIRVATADGQVIRIPAVPISREMVTVWTKGEDSYVKVPTISPVFPDVVGEEPVFSLVEVESISSLEVEFAFRRGGEIVGGLDVFFSISRGVDYLGICFSNRASGDADEFFSNRFRSRIATIMAEGEAVAAIYGGMEVCSWFEDQSTFEAHDPDEGEDERDTDTFVKFLLELRGEAP